MHKNGQDEYQQIDLFNLQNNNNNNNYNWRASYVMYKGILLAPKSQLAVDARPLKCIQWPEIIEILKNSLIIKVTRNIGIRFLSNN